jgi:hypothetical protein
MHTPGRWSGWLLACGLLAGCQQSEEPFGVTPTSGKSPARKTEAVAQTPVPKTPVPEPSPPRIPEPSPPKVTGTLPASVPLPEIFGKSVASTTDPTPAPENSSPIGTWKWNSSFGNSEYVLKARVEGRRLIGHVMFRGRDIPITDGRYDDGEVSFTVVRERDGERTVSRYVGKISGNTIRGTVDSDFGGQNRKRDWEASRVNN